MMTSSSSSSYEIPPPAYEDLDAPVPAVTDRKQSEVQVKPVPRPRSKTHKKEQCNKNDTSGSEDKTNTTTNTARTQNNEYSSDHKRLLPVRPPPRPPVNLLMISSKPTPVTENLYTNTQPSVKPPAVSTEQTQHHAHRPERPPPPSNYYSRSTSTTGVQSKSKTEECQQSTSISSKQDPASSALPEKMLNLNRNYAEKVATSDDKPAVPPRPRHSLPSCYASVCEPLSTQSRPPPPIFNPPPPPSTEPVYSELDSPYLEILPVEDKMKQGKSTLCSEQQKRSSIISLHQQSTENTDEVNGMLRWLKKVSNPNYMTLSVYGISIEEEIRSFNQRALNVSRALRLFNLLMMKRNEGLRNTIAEFNSISDSLDKLQKKSKTMGIAGGTTGAVGGVTAVVGIALAPVTMGASLIATAVGAGIVASAGGMSAHTAKARKKVVNRTTVEKLVNEYETNIVDLEHCLDFILSGMNELRRHDFARLQRAGAQSEAVRMAHLSQSVFNNMNSSTGGMSSERLLLAFSKEMDQYFTEKDGQKLKKMNKSKFSGRVRLLAQNLQDDLEYLNHMWETFT